MAADRKVSMLRVVALTSSVAFSEDTKAHWGQVLGEKLSLKSLHLNDIVEELQTVKPDVLLIDTVGITEKSLLPLLDVCAIAKNIRVVCAGYPSDVSILLKLTKAGVKDFLKFPFDLTELKDVLHEISKSSSTDPPGQTGRSKVISLYSPKGGAGVTLITTNLAVALASKGKNTVVVCDFSPQCGDVANYLNLVPAHTFYDIFTNVSLLDTSFLSGIMLEHSSGVEVLAAPRDDAQKPNGSHSKAVKETLALLKENHQFILIDASHLETELLEYVMTESDTIFLIGNPDVVSLNGLLNFFNKQKSLHFDSRNIKVLINRYNSKYQIDESEFKKVTKFPITCRLPNDYMLCIEAVNTGRPVFEVQEKANLSRALIQLADTMRDDPDAVRKNGASSPNKALDFIKKGLFK